MNKTKIPWADYTINPVKGLCPMACSYCYARAMYKRYKWDETIRFAPSVFNDIPKMKAGSKVFVGSTIELFGEWIDPAWMMLTFERVRAHPELTFIFLTKQPQNLYRYAPYPKNAWIGISYEGAGAAKENEKLFGFTGIHAYFRDLGAYTKFMSIEPLLRPCTPILNGIDIFDWIIIGAQTPRSERTFPKWAWVKEIIEAADKANIPVFLKDNLGLLRLSCEGGKPYYKEHPSGTMELRQEFPA
uniref:Radical SAM superfamily protein n=1 Tax=viral metagenome TaxID=1070528 RepID=A0A6M3LJK4_9ZZZZ